MSKIRIIKTFLSITFSLMAPVAFGADLLYEHSSRPLQAEGSMEAMEPWETPISGFFIRSHFGEPVVDETQWILKIDGLVDKPLVFTLADLRKMARKNIHAVLECSGNGRAQQKPSVPGVQWQRGAVGNAEWGGVSLSEILSKAGIKENARFARIEGADKPTLPTMPGFIRSVPLSRLQKEDTLLAMSMNREPLPILHGGPLRLILPGWYGENWMKWLTHITLTAEEDSGFFMKKAYRLPKTSVKPGEPWDSSTGSPIDQILVQSFIVSPVAGQILGGGEISIRGKAFSGDATISKVEISLDQGKTWEPAQVEPPHASGGWQEFSKTIQVNTPGNLALMSRATDSRGTQQPLTAVWNPGGYLRNAVDSVEVKVSQESSLGGKTLVTQRCLICHARELIEGQRLTPKQWDGVLKKMEGFGVQLEPNDRHTLLEYLETFSPDLPPKNPIVVNYEAKKAAFEKTEKLIGNAKRGAALFAKNCVVCHGTQGEGKLGPRLIGRAIPHSEFWQTVLNGKRTMPAFGKILKKQEIADIQSFILKR